MKRVLGVAALALAFGVLEVSTAAFVQERKVRVGPLADDQPSSEAPARRGDKKAANKAETPRPPAREKSADASKADAKPGAARPENGEADKKSVALSSAPIDANSPATTSDAPVKSNPLTPLPASSKVDPPMAGATAPSVAGDNHTNASPANGGNGSKTNNDSKTGNAAKNSNAAKPTGNNAKTASNNTKSTPTSTPASASATPASSASTPKAAAANTSPSGASTVPAASTGSNSSTNTGTPSPVNTSAANSATPANAVPATSAPATTSAPGASSSTNGANGASSPASETNANTSAANASAANSSAANALAAASVYRTGVGDVLDIRLLNQGTTRESTLYTVMAGGLLEYPLAGDPVVVSGLTPEEIGARLATALKKRAVYERPQVIVSVREYVSHTVLVSGLVGDPGAKIMRREAVPLYVVVAEAQPHPDAGRAIVISHATGQSTPVDLSDTSAMGMLVHAGDVVNVQSRPKEYFYIGGEIITGGQKDFHAGLTLTQAVLTAGGVTRLTNNKIRVSRQGADGRLVSTEYNLKEIETGKIPDPRLQPGDRIEVLRKKD